MRREYTASPGTPVPPSGTVTRAIQLSSRSSKRASVWAHAAPSTALDVATRSTATAAVASATVFSGPGSIADVNVAAAGLGGRHTWNWKFVSIGLVLYSAAGGGSLRPQVLP